MNTRKVTFLIPASPNAAFMSQIAAFNFAVKRLKWTHWLPTILVCFGEGLDRDAYEAYDNWRAYLKDPTIVFASESQPNEYWHNQMDGIYRWAPRDADALVRMDADTLPVGNLEDILDLVVERSAIAGTIAHYRFPAAPGVSNQEAWLKAAEGLTPKPLQFDYNYALVGTDVNAQDRSTPYYLNDGCVFFARRYFDEFVPLYLDMRPKIMKRLEAPWFACQVALTLAVASIDLPAIALPLRYNFPNDEVASDRYPEEMRAAVVMHYLNRKEFNRHDIFRSADSYSDLMSKPLNAPNEAFRLAVLKIFGKAYPFSVKEDSVRLGTKEVPKSTWIGTLGKLFGA